MAGSELNPKLRSQIEEILGDNPIADSYDHTRFGEMRFELYSPLIRECLVFLGRSEEFRAMFNSTHPDICIENFLLPKNSDVYSVTYRKIPMARKSMGKEEFVLEKNGTERVSIIKYFLRGGRVDARMSYWNSQVKKVKHEGENYPLKDLVYIEGERMIEEFTEK